MRTDLLPPRFAVVDVVARSLAEDLTPLGDLTAGLLPGDLSASAAFVARSPGVVAGVTCATETFAQLDPSVTVRWVRTDGEAVIAGEVLGRVEGPLASVLTGERTALNLLGHLSGIATRTAAYVDAVAGSGTRIWDTRKTTPGLRSLAKAAVRAGGGANHRGNLSEWVMLKDNLLAHLGITGAVRAAAERWPGRTVHVECDRLDQVREATEAGAGALLLDNMAPEEVRAAVAAVDDVVGGGRRPLVEVSGEVSLATVASYAGPGVDCISVGEITKAAGVLDIGLDVADG